METISKDLVMTRTMYCPKCAVNSAPKIGNMVLVYKGNTKNYFCFSIKKGAIVSEHGFTPHIISKPEIIDSLGETVTFEAVCGMNGCGIELKLNESYQWTFSITNSEITTLPINDFVALMNFKDKSYYVNEIV